MPSHDLLVGLPSPLAFLRIKCDILQQLYFQSDLTLIRSWYLNGKHYSRTLEDWLRRQDRNKKEGLDELERDAEAKGLAAEEGRKAFYRSVIPGTRQRRRLDLTLSSLSPSGSGCFT